MTFEEDLERCIFSGRHSTRDMFIRAVTRSGFFLEYQTVRFAEMILRDRCSTSYDLAVVGAVLLTGGVEKSQHAFVRGRQLCTQLSIFEGRLAKLLCF